MYTLRIPRHHGKKTLSRDLAQWCRGRPGVEAKTNPDEIVVTAREWKPFLTVFATMVSFFHDAGINPACLRWTLAD